MAPFCNNGELLSTFVITNNVYMLNDRCVGLKLLSHSVNLVK
jgi:hypothetical protein